MEQARILVRPADIGKVRSFGRVVELVGRGERLRAEDWTVVAADYLHFSQSFPAALETLIRRLPEDRAYVEIRSSLEAIHTEEVGRSTHGVPHADMFKDFMNAVGVKTDWCSAPIANESTNELVTGLARLYADRSLEAALGAQAAFEMIGEEIIRAFSYIAFRATDVPRHHLRYFDEHLVAERGHVDFMTRVAGILEASSTEARARDAFLCGAAQAGKLLRQFWSDLWRGVFPRERVGKLLFLSWSGIAARGVAEEFKRTLLEHFPVIQPEDIFFSDTDIHSGLHWRDSIDQHISAAIAALVVLSPHSVTSAWVNFEAGRLHDRKPVADGHQLHVLVLGTSPERFVDAAHPLSHIQRMNGGQYGSFVRRIVAEAERRRPNYPGHSEEQSQAAAARLEQIATRWSVEADREYERRPENAIRWLEYLLSLTSRQGPTRRPIPGTPSSLRSMADVQAALHQLVQRLMGQRIPPGKRVYLATRMSERARGLTDGYLYRLLYSVAGLDAEGRWIEHSLVGPSSLIHRCFEYQRPQPEGDTVGAPVPGEEAVCCRPVTLDGHVLAVIGLSSDTKDPSGRMTDLAIEFEGILQWFFSIASAHMRKKSFSLLRDGSFTVTETSTDADVAQALEEQLRYIDEFAGFEGPAGSRRPKDGVLIASSVASGGRIRSASSP